MAHYLGYPRFPPGGGCIADLWGSMTTAGPSRRSVSGVAAGDSPGCRPNRSPFLAVLLVAVAAAVSGCDTTEPSTATLTAIVLDPDSVVVLAGTTQQFSVRGIMSDGSSVTPSVNYTATGGSISASGLYTAGPNAAEFQVVTVLADGTLSDSSPVRVTYPSNSWTTRAPMPTPRYGPAVGAVDGILYAIGGQTDTGYVAVVEAYDPTTNSWTTKAPMPTPRGYLGAGVINGVLYAVGGRDQDGPLAVVEAYDPVSDAWTVRAPLLAPAAGELSVAVVSGVLYSVGGRYWRGVSAYNAATNSWSARALMSQGRYAFAAGVVDGRVYVAGGYDGYSILSSAERFDPLTNTWAPIPSLARPRSQIAGVGLDGLFYIVGGNLPMQSYDPITGTWTTLALPKVGRSDPALGVVSGLVYAVGGFANGVSNYVEAYQP